MYKNRDPLEGNPHISTQKPPGNYINGLPPSSDGPLIKQQIDLKNGKAVRMTNKENSTNHVLFYRYHGFKGLWFFIIDTGANFENFLGALFVIVHYISQDQIQMTYFFPVIVVILNIVVSAITNFFVDLNLKRSCIVINKKEVKKFCFSKKKRKFESKYWESIMPGDIIKISENQEFPADVLILDVVSNMDHICYVLGSQHEETSLPALKKACEGTQNKTGMKMFNSQFVEQISGVVKFEYNYSGFFQGTFKLSNSPAAFNLSIENIATRGSYLCNTKGVICLVLNVGQDCIENIFAGNKRSTLHSTKNPYFPSKKQFDRVYNSFRILQLVMVAIYILISFIVVFQSKVNTQVKYYKFIYYVIESYSHDVSATSFVLSILSFISGLLLALPLSYKIVLDLISLMHSNYTEWDYNNIPATVKFNHGITTKIMGQIHHLFISKQSLMSHNVKKVKVTKIREVKYQDKEPEDFTAPEEEKTNLLHQQSVTFKHQGDKRNSHSYQPSAFKRHANNNDQQHNSNIEEDETMQTMMDEYLPNCIKFKNTFSNDQLKQDLHLTNTFGEIIQSFFKALTLCHQATRRRVPSAYSKSNYKSIYSDDQAQLMFAESYGYQFISRKNKSITIQIANSVYHDRLDVVIIQSFYCYDQRITAIVIRELQNNIPSTTLYMKGPIRAMREFISFSSFDPSDFELDIKSFAEMGLWPILFAKKDFNDDETQEFERRINDALGDVKNSEEKIVNTLLQYSFDLEALGIIGVQEIYNLRDSLVIQDAIKNGIKVWMLTRDEDILQYEITYMQMVPLIVNGENERDIEEQMKTALKALSEQTLTNQIQDSAQTTKKRVLIFDGISLFIVLKDEQLLAQFLTVATLCHFVIGCSVTPFQKAELLRAVKQFSQNSEFAMAIISSSEDQKLILEADISIAINARYKQSDALVMADIIMKDFYPLTYIIFKHGTLCQRRLFVATCLFIYRALMVSILQLYFMTMNGLSAVIPVNQLVYISFLTVISPLQIFLIGISYKDVGYDHLHRVYGEYKRNFKEGLFNRHNILYMTFNACFDCVLFYLMTWQTDYPISLYSGFTPSLSGMELYFACLIHTLFGFQLANFSQVVQIFQAAVIFCCLLGMVFILDDDQYLVGIQEFIYTPQYILYLIFVILVAKLRNYALDVLQKLVLPLYVKRFKYYQDIEDRLYLEEYEDPNQEFHLREFQDDYKKIQQKILQKKRATINNNLMKLHRSDSMDQIIEKLNKGLGGDASDSFRDSSMMNLITLKFNDSNKEIEYNELKTREIIVTLRKILALCFLFGGVELITEIVLYAFGKIVFVSFYYYCGLLVLFLIVLVCSYKFNRKIHIMMPAFLAILVIYYCFNYFYEVQIEFSQFSSILTMVFMLRGVSMNFVILIVICGYILQINLVQVVFKQQSNQRLVDFSEENNTSIFMPFLALMELAFIVLWCAYIYGAEKQRKLDFWIGNKKVKEFTKLKSILNLLMPAFVRERISQGHRFIADDQGDVTIFFCDIHDFDKIVQMYSGKELCELLDHIYNALDQLCEQHGLQKVETVGKTYMACGGLKVIEKKMESRLLSRHHSVRVIDFAFDVMGFMQQQFRKDGEQLMVKIGIHSGKVISGVVGENKPQFSLIGDTVNKTSRVCSKCEAKMICVSRETYALVDELWDQFQFTGFEVEMKGFGRQLIYSVRKKKKLGRVVKGEAHKKPFPPLLGRIQKEGSRQGQEDEQFGSQESIIINDMSQQEDNSVLSSEKSETSTDSQNESFKEQSNFAGFGDMKDDRKIAKNPVENSQYDLVERPAYLLVFKETLQEKKFLFLQIKVQQYMCLLFLLSFILLNKIMLTFYVLEYTQTHRTQIFFYVLAPLVALYELFLLVRLRYVTLAQAAVFSLLLTLYFHLVTLLIALQFLHQDHNSRPVQLFLIEVIITLSMAYFVEVLFLKQIISTCVWGVLCCLVINCLQYHQMSVKTYSFFFELLFVSSMLIYRAYAREMIRRKIHNREKMADVEIKRTSDLLGNLVPPPVLHGIKSDLKVVDELEDVTLLFTDMVNFATFTNTVQDPRVVVKLLSDLFTRFDQLCVNYGVYKVHTIGDCYVILGYNGHIPIHERTDQIKAEEAFKVVQAGFEMIEIIQQIREQSPELKQLDMRIGIHTGKIVAGIIGSKIVRYDIFGQDVLIANKMESNGLPGQVVLSQYTKEWLESEPHLSEKLDFEEYKQVELESVGRVVEMFVVKQRESTIGSNSSIRVENEGENSQDYDSESGEDQLEELKQNIKN